MHSEREQFEFAIAQDPYDGCLRLVFADWLEERAESPEIVKFQREWTPEWQKSDDWMRAFAEKSKVSIKSIVAGVNHYIETGEPSMPGGYPGFGVTEQFDLEGELTSEFWRHWEAWTKTVVPEDMKYREPFECCDGWDCCEK